MADLQMPDVLHKRNLLFPPPTANEEQAMARRVNQIALGKAYCGQGDFYDALDFFYQAQHAEGVEQVKTMARDLGDYFLAKQVQRYQRQPLPAPFWNELAAHAVEQGKLMFALQAYREAGNAEQVTILLEQCKQSGQGKFFDRLEQLMADH